MIGLGNLAIIYRNFEQAKKARYLKEVDYKEVTIKFWQEVYGEENTLREIHEKYPIDKGH